MTSRRGRPESSLTSPAMEKRELSSITEGLICDTLHNYHYAEFRVLSIIMLNVDMLIVFTLSARARFKIE